MKRIALFPLCAILIAFSAIAAPTNIADHIKQIDAALTTMQKRDRLVYGVGYAPEGTTLVAYSKNGQYQKFAVEELYESGFQDTYFYFDEGQLIHVLIQSYAYPYRTEIRSDDPPHDEFVKGKGDKLRADERYDFADGKLLRWTSFHKPNAVTNPEYAEHQTDLPAQANAYKILMDTHSSKGDQGGWTCAAFTPDDKYCTRFKNDSE